MIIKCKMCGGDLNFTEGSAVCECEYCGSVQTIPNADSEKKTNLFNRANRLRMNSEFDKASAIYEQIVAEFPEEAEAYWGLCLCAYGIEYVDDPVTGEKKPTCHRTLPTSIMEEGNFEQACDNADIIARKLYREEAKAIDRIQKDILSIAANEPPYDVFICYKETDMKGSRTEDSVLAQEIYDALTAKGMKVFFSRITLEDKLGVQYEPYIYAALSSARVMLAVGTQFEYYDAVWVKNEWSRYLGMMKEDRRKSLVPCFKGLDAYDMPVQFKGLQAQDMGKLGWLQDLVRGVEKLCGRTAVSAPAMPVQQTIVTENTQAGSNIANLMQRVNLFLQDGEWAKAEEYINKVLDIDAQYAPAYCALVLKKHKLKQESALSTLRESIDNDADWKKALQFADPEQKKIYAPYANTINYGEVYAAATNAQSRGAFHRAILEYVKARDFKDSRERLKQCIDIYRKWITEEKSREYKEKLTGPEAVVKQKQNAVQCLKIDLQSEKAKQAESESKKNSILEDISQKTQELSQLRGLFSGGKKKALEIEINVLKSNLNDAENSLSLAARNLSKLEVVLNNAEAELENARKELQTLQTQLADEKAVFLTDEGVIAAATTAVAFDAVYQLGKYVNFGHYSQTGEGNDNSPIEWLVLARDGNKALLLSRYGLDAKPYNTEETNITWENCTLRRWLNDDFLNKAFFTREQNAIVQTTVDNSGSQCYSKWDTNGGNKTLDKVFLLSYAEANKYFGVTCGDHNNTKSRVEPTAYAIAQGAETLSDFETADGADAVAWWLRSPGYSQFGAAHVSRDGSLRSNLVSYVSGSVRPALWVNPESVIF